MAKSKTPAPQPQTAVVTRTDKLPAIPAAAEIDYDSFGQMSKEDLAIPFLIILQPLSPQCTPGHAKQVEGATPGMILQTVTNELFNSVLVVPAEYKRSFIEWVPREKGGGFRGEHGTEFEKMYDSLARDDKGRRFMDSGNHLADTRNWYVITVRPDGSRFPAIISMGSTAIKVSKQWNTMQTMPPPTHDTAEHGPLGRSSYLWRLRTVLNKNDKGSWYGWAPQRVDHAPEVVRQECLAFRGQVRGGNVVVDHAQMDSGAESGGDNSDM